MMFITYKDVLLHLIILILILKITLKNNYYLLISVKPNIQDDIYELFYYDNNNLTFLDYALITTFKKSVFMNSIFRNIKENINLDTLEESDDEDDFENTNPNKYIIPNKKLLLNVYIPRIQ